MIRRVVFFCFLALAVALPEPSARASDAREKLQRLESQLDAQKAQQATLDEKSRAASENLKDLRQKLIAATTGLAAKENEQGRLEDKLAELAADTKIKEAELAGERRKLGLLTQALLELSFQPPESLLLQSGLTADTIHRTILLRAVLPRVKAQTEDLARDLVSLNDLKAQMAAQKRLVASASANLLDQRRALDQMIRTRQGLLQRTEQQKQQLAARLVALTGAAKDLRQLLEKVTPRRAPRAPSGPVSTVTLKAPVAGRILHHFGDRDADGVTSEGVTFAALPAAPVVAPMAGRVVFAGAFKGYGQIVILQHANGYHSFLAGFGRIDADMDQDVEAGEPLGVTPMDDGARPAFYFEWRRGGEPVNPVGLIGGR